MTVLRQPGVFSLMIGAMFLNAPAISAEDGPQELFLQAWNAEMGIREKIDLRQAVIRYRKADNAGHPYARGRLGVIACRLGIRGVESQPGNNDVQTGVITRDEYTQSDEYCKISIGSLRKHAADGDVYAQVTLGECLFYGYGTRIERREAVKLFEKAADNGSAVAQVEYGRCFLRGEVSQYSTLAADQSWAAKYFLMAAEQGDARGQRFMGWACLTGRGVPKDLEKATKWYVAAAEQGDGEALKVVSEAYRDSSEKDRGHQRKLYDAIGEREVKDFERRIQVREGSRRPGPYD